MPTEKFPVRQVCKYVLMTATRRAATTNCVLPVSHPVMGTVWDVLWGELIHTMAARSPRLCLSSQHWVSIPARESTGQGVSYLRHDLAWHCLYLSLNKALTNINKSLIPEEAEFLAS